MAYDWVKWYDSNSKYREPRERLGRWLGPSLDIGPAMTSKIMKDHGQLIHVSTLRPLTQDKVDNPNEIAKHKAFDT